AALVASAVAVFVSVGIGGGTGNVKVEQTSAEAPLDEATTTTDILKPGLTVRYLIRTVDGATEYTATFDNGRMAIGTVPMDRLDLSTGWHFFQRIIGWEWDGGSKVAA
ncbi:MAG: hypothetical protein ACRD0O_10255, partial [Acidimicrobiia bacterium]